MTMPGCILWCLILALGVPFGHGQQVTPEPRMYYLHIRSDIKFRFCTTMVTSKVMNPSSVAQETTFQVTIPEEAFITSFQMEIDGRLYPAHIEEKISADSKYQRSKMNGQTAGQSEYRCIILDGRNILMQYLPETEPTELIDFSLVYRPRDTNKFQVEVNIAAYSTVTFNMTYQNLLSRNQGTYEHVIYIDPEQVVDDLRVDVAIQESRPITKINVPPLRNKILTKYQEIARNELVSIDQPTRSTAQIHFYPSVEDQRFVTDQGISGLFIVEYDIDRNFDAGDIVVLNGYFVHYFAPSGMDPIPKDILFVLDTSSSMFGTKLAQLRDAMHIILNDLHSSDRFNIIKFNTGTTFWKPGEVITATRRNIAEAEGYIATMTSNGWTNINEAMTFGIDFLNSVIDEKGRVKLMVFLTDGAPTKGVEDTEIILANVIARNTGNIAIFSIAFGEDADYEFVKKVALQNDGVARKIYADSDAVLQISGFYEEISRAALKNVTFKYQDSSSNLDNLTKTSFNSFFSDSELVVAGRIKNSELRTFSLSVEGKGVQGEVELVLISNILEHITPTYFPSLIEPADFQKITETIWAYVTIKQLLDEAIGEHNATVQEREVIREKIIALSLKYHFVTPLSSLVVAKPEEREVGNLIDGVDAELARDSPEPTQDPFAGYLWGRRPGSRRKSVNGKSTEGGGGGDPHFMIRIEGLSHPVCFDIMGEPGNVLRLLKDPVKGITINALIIPGRKRRKDGGMRTYFGKVVIMIRNITVIVDPASLLLNGASLSWDDESPFSIHDIRLTMFTDNSDTRVLHVDIRNGIRISVKRRLARDTTQVDYLNVNIDREDTLSKKAGGILGEIHRKRITMRDIYVNKSGFKIGKLIVKDGQSRFRVKTRLKERHNVLDGHVEKCWSAYKHDQGLLTGDYYSEGLYDP